MGSRAFCKFKCELFPDEVRSEEHRPMGSRQRIWGDFRIENVDMK